MNIRPFEDLIKPIEYDGKTFVPIEEIAKLAVAVNKKKFKHSEIFFLDRSIFCALNFVKGGENMQVNINSKFSVGVYNHTYDWCLDCCNQVQIVKNLIKWGFIEP